MKIKTITCHEVYNYGASLQEYALLKFLEDLGHETETIHYKPSYLSNHFKLLEVNNDFFSKNIVLRIIYVILKFPKRLINLKRKKSFDEFAINYIKSTKKLYKTNDELKLNVPEADAFICGSDQIWNSFFENGRDPAFYLDFVPNDKLKISYAASFAIDSVEDKFKGFVKEKVARLDHVSVRELSGKKILDDLGINHVTQVLDPVFLLEPEKWNQLITVDKEKDKYIFIYDFDSNPLIKKMAENYKRKYGWKIITVNELINYADKNYFLEGPIKFLSLVKNAEFVISNSFHAVAFSIIFKKEFVVFNRQDKINTRMRDLLASIGQNQLLIMDDDMVKKHALYKIDYDRVQEYLEPLTETSIKFLTNSLKIYD
ncbi:polysaccharide pyruvyl transferase family protein [Mariniflexile maritimum]|uniref:polysaccharide pyruvyl transferase family protein n=1 Tax=Mariniflexile maritimum TaxID=2682493 RepID=UPI0012F6C261|nr:polysaccharide pyruvyl transferase family protein [Mariniflexile maritimum]